jgi:glutamate synthase (NADPH) small chain
MGETTGFKQFDREVAPYRPREERLADWRDVAEAMPDEKVKVQGARCMECGVPFCHWGCPLGNIIPDWNEMVYRGRWRQAIETLHATNNFPELTGRICPAPCEESCVLNIDERPIAIRQIELNIIEHAFAEGWITPRIAPEPTGKKVAVVGSGPAGLACAQQLARAGHDVTVFERDEVIGGLLSIGIPDFKLEKHIVQRRLDQMAAEGVIFKTGVHIGMDVSLDELRHLFDAVCLAGGARQARELPIPGNELEGIHFAMDFLAQQNRRVGGREILDGEITAKGKRVVVIGGGDTGSDCVGTSNRHGATEVIQIELLPRPSLSRGDEMAWPHWPMVMRTSSSHEEGCDRHWSLSTKRFSGSGGKVEKLHMVKLDWSEPDEQGRRVMTEVKGSEFTVDADLVLLAMGFAHPEHGGMLEQLGVELDERGNVRANRAFATNVPGVFTAGDMRRGQSLVVWAICEGREAAHHIDAYLMGSSDLPLRDQ